MVLDSSIWIEIFLEGPKLKECEKLLKLNPIYVPSLVLFEIYKKIKLKGSEDLALECVAHLSQYSVIGFTRDVALLAADLAIEFKLSMADSIVLSHSRILSCPLVTLDNDFESIPDVKLMR